MQGVKYDGEKPRWDLLPMEEVEEVVKVLTFGAKKYSDDNWMLVKPFRKRYFAALMRHIVDRYFRGERLDPQSGLPHLAHAGCNLFFLMWHDRQENIGHKTHKVGQKGE